MMYGVRIKEYRWVSEIGGVAELVESTGLENRRTFHVPWVRIPPPPQLWEDVDRQPTVPEESSAAYFAKRMMS